MLFSKSLITNKADMVFENDVDLKAPGGRSFNARMPQM